MEKLNKVTQLSWWKIFFSHWLNSQNFPKEKKVSKSQFCKTGIQRKAANFKLRHCNYFGKNTMCSVERQRNEVACTV